MSGIYSQGPGPTERDTTLRDLLAVVFKRKWIILGIFLVTSLIIGLKTVTTPTTYTADATLLLNRQGARSSVLERISRALPWVEVVESEIEVLQSMPVLQKARAKLQDPAEGDPVDISLGKLSKSIATGVVGESNVLFVSGTHLDPQIAQRITNAVAESYVEYHDQIYELPNAMGIIGARADTVFARLETLEAERSAILRQLGTGNIDHQNQRLTDRREQLRLRLSGNERDIARLRTQIEDAKRFLANEAGTLPFTENTGSVQGGSMVERVRRLNRERDTLRELQDKYTEKHPQVVEARRAVASLEASVEEHTQQMIAMREHELRVAQSVNDALVRQLDELETEIGRILDNSSRLQTLESQISSLQSQYAELSEQSVDSEINRQSFRDYSVAVLSPAVGARANAKADMVRLALGPILALMAGIGLAFYLENLDHSLGNRDDVEQHLEIPVLASFPDSDDALQEPPAPEESIPFRRKGNEVRT
ncbi:MAG TPA: Wzz/FepE/Etk N-terminal domain-containing protein [Candidatus Krumholzibacteria bacterium]|nr:Wzz/FepE/Etk N-terminal domain-containing protein [Candidatus Krumholzibacteria bacterium]